MCPRSVLLLLFVYWNIWTSVAGNDKKVQPASVHDARVNIGKCCEPEELLVDDRCILLAETNETRWRPEFLEERDPTTGRRKSTEPNYELKIGRPRCGPNEHQWHVYYYPSGPDSLAILPNGVLRHYIVDLTKGTSDNHGVYGAAMSNDDDDDEDEQEHATIHYDYQFGHYCADKAILTEDHLVATYAMLCVPDVAVRWTDTNYLMRHAIDPAFHAISMACYLIVAVIYFVLPQLRDLVGNVITSMALCLAVSQCASTVRIFTEFSNHISFIIVDMVMYISLVASFFWLSALGYYVWTTFKSRNVFLRVTDGKKYCYYSLWVWSLTACIGSTAIFAHFALETNKPTVGDTIFSQETMGWLGLSVIFMMIALVALIDICIVLTTMNRIKRMSTYGRIHHKMKYSFRMFILLFAILSAGWLSLLMSRLKYDVLMYYHIVINLLQALLVLYVCVFGQRRVTFLLGKTCNCCNSGDNTEGLDWGEEMTAINAGY